MADTHGKVMFKLFEPMSPQPGWKCSKWFKLSLGEPWESEGSNDSDTDTDELWYVRKMEIKNTLGVKKCKANQKQQSKWLDMATRSDMKLRPRNLVGSCIKFCFKILVC